MTSVTTYLAKSRSRRSFLALAGRASLVMAGGGLVSLARPQDALATYCGSGHSVSCIYLDGWNTNSCPGDSCPNSTVYWTDCTSLCASPAHTRLYDCCSKCTNGIHCTGCHCDSTGPSSCCYSRSDPGAWCAANCAPDSQHVCCRRYECYNGGIVC
jgi:hypothetical protein